MSNTNSTGTMDPMVELARLRAENEALKAKDAKRSVLTLKVSDKGAVSLYGMGRFPTTLYAQQWEKVLNHADTIRAFLKDNQSKLATKE
jgi:hypothetical protein